MIPKNITKEHILKAIEEIDKTPIPENRKSKKFYLEYKGKLYPPKYVISLANKFANGKELSPDEFEGGKETNSFLRKLGFNIILNCLLIITVLIKVENDNTKYKDRKILLKEIVNKIKNYYNNEKVIIILPAGYFKFKRNINYNKIENDTKKILEDKKNFIICLGIDGNFTNNLPKDQIAIAVDYTGILAAGRKFYPTKDEKKEIIASKDINEEIKINKKPFKRIFSINKKNFYLMVCYDIFGIKHKKLTKPSNEIVLLNLIHQFKNSEANFIRHGLAGASGTWKCPVFCSAFFYKNISKNFPSGVLWNSEITRTSECRYEKIKINPKEQVNNFKMNNNEIIINIFEI